MTVTASPGLSFAFTDEQQLFRASLEEWVDERLSKERCREIEARDTFPRDRWDDLSEQGRHGVGIAEEHGARAAGSSSR